MEIEIELDDNLLASALEICGITDINELVRFALEEMVRAEEEKRKRPDGDHFFVESG